MCHKIRNLLRLDFSFIFKSYLELQRKLLNSCWFRIQDFV